MSQFYLVISRAFNFSLEFVPVQLIGVLDVGFPRCEIDRARRNFLEIAAHVLDKRLARLAMRASDCDGGFHSIMWPHAL